MPYSQNDIFQFFEQYLAAHSLAADTHVERIDTHGASIFLAGERAWKMKRAVRFSFMDFSTSEQRRAMLMNELTLNRRTAPELYLDVHAITEEADGTLALDGQGEPVDWALEMRRFRDDALLSQMADRGVLSLQQLKTLTDQVVAFHDAAPIVKDPDGYTRFLSVTQGNIESLKACEDILGAREVQTISSALLASIKSMKSLLTERAMSSRVRHVHGDLHLANIALINDVPTPFDCLEFDTELATTDTLYDIAFLIMDLWQRNLKGEANEVFNRYLDLSPADEAGVALMPLFLATRAVIRAHVGAARAQRLGPESDIAIEARSYLQLAQTFLEPAATRLLAVGGLSGSGKSTPARAVAPLLGRAPGARLLRSDVLRKRMTGARPETPLPAEAYTQKESERVYRHMNALAITIASTGQSVIVDAVFARHDERQHIREQACAIHVDFQGIWLDCDLATRVARVSMRKGDASDADAEVAQRQSAEALTTKDWQHVKADGPVDVLALDVIHIMNND